MKSKSKSCKLELLLCGRGVGNEETHLQPRIKAATLLRRRQFPETLNWAHPSGLPLAVRHRGGAIVSTALLHHSGCFEAARLQGYEKGRKASSSEAAATTQQAFVLLESSPCTLRRASGTIESDAGVAVAIVDSIFSHRPLSSNRTPDLTVQ